MTVTAPGIDAAVAARHARIDRADDGRGRIDDSPAEYSEHHLRHELNLPTMEG